MNTAALTPLPERSAPRDEELKRTTEKAKASTRTGKVLLDVTRPFAKEDLRRSWSELGSTYLCAAACVALALAPIPWPLRAIGSVVLGLTLVRVFILYHDFMHGAYLRRSRLARWLMFLSGTYLLTPPIIWRETHNFHHANTAKLVGSDIGSYRTASIDMWRKMNWKQRLHYRLTRHPATIFSAILTVFLLNMCVIPFFRSPKRHWGGFVAMAFSGIFSWFLISRGGWQLFLLVYLVPMWIATMLGAYLFYAQHNFPEVHIQPREEWDYTRAALESSSYMPMGRVMAWFAGNIGYHHVHHLNSLIPFYRLPEAMQNIPELQDPGETSLALRDVFSCLRLKLWDPDAQRMVPYP